MAGTTTGFDFTAAVRSLCADMVVRTDALRHIDLEVVAFSAAQTRKSVSYGMQASLTPLRFEGGASKGVKLGRRYTVQKVIGRHGQEYLYILTFYLPRFLNYSFEEKLTTVVHELWHISPLCDGDLRRHEGHCYAHGNSQSEYDRHVAGIAREWLAANPPLHCYAFLQHTFAELQREYGGVVGSRYSVPKLIPL